MIKGEFVRAIILLLTCFTFSCEAAYNIFANNAEGTVCCTVTGGFYATRKQTLGIGYVITKNIQPDNSSKYYWAIASRGLHGFLRWILQK